MRCWSPLSLFPLLLVGCVQQTALRAPSSFVPFEAPDKAFKGLRPDGWREVAGASQGIMSGISFNKYDAKIGITADLQGSLQADISRASSAQVESIEGMLPPGMSVPKTEQPRPPVEQLHLAHRGRASRELINYAEHPMQALQSRLGEGRLSEFTGDIKAPFGSNKVHGYRATILSGDREVTVVARCWETDWAALQPAFVKVIESLDSSAP